MIGDRQEISWTRWGAIGPSKVQVIFCRSPNPFGRRITYLRVSVTDRCNLPCTYSIRELGIRPALEAALTNKPKHGESCTHSWMHGIGG